VPVGSTIEWRITNFDIFSTYVVSVSSGSVSRGADRITYTAPAAAGTVTLTVTVNGVVREISVSIENNVLIPQPEAPPSIGSALEGGFYFGTIWDTILNVGVDLAIGMGSVSLPVPSGSHPFYLGQQVKLRPAGYNGDDEMLGTVAGLTANVLTVNVTSASGAGQSYTSWVVVGRWKLILAPKSVGEAGPVQYKTANTASPAETRTLTNGKAATAAMVAAGSHPAAAFCAGLSVGGYIDWYLPARDELELIWRNLKPVTNNNSTAAQPVATASYTRDGNYGGYGGMGYNRHSAPPGAAYGGSVPAQTPLIDFQAGGAEAMGFGADYYWSSSEFSDTHGWRQYYDTSTPGHQHNLTKTTSHRARAVRRSIL
jgi:hypothetical protein